MIKIYGTGLCKDCVAFKASLDANGVEYDFRDIGSDLKALKEFISAVSWLYCYNKGYSYEKMKLRIKKNS